MTERSEWDYIVVGAGSAGAVVAARLSEDPGTSVLLIEAGGSHRHPNVMIPAAFAKQFGTSRDWGYRTEPEPYLDDRRLIQPRARSLGGCSTMNAMIYIRGHRSDYDGWAREGAEGWSYDELLPLFKRSERNSRGASQYHGGSGELYVEDPRDPNPVSQQLVEAAVDMGHPPNGDFNGAEQVGAGLFQTTLKRGARWTTADGFIGPARRRPNLDVRAKTLVTRLVLDGGRAVGVEVRGTHGAPEVLRAGREVVVSAGAFGTPHLLMLSGIGPADHLREHGIETLVDSPHVGAHLQDHPLYVVNYETTATGTLAEAEKPVQLVRFLATRRGLLTSNVAEFGVFLHTRDGEEAPDIQFMGGPAYFWQHGQATYEKPAWAIGLSLVGPRSEGTVRLRSADPTVLPAVRFNYFQDPADMASIVAAIEQARELAATVRMKPITGPEIHPGASATSRADLEAHVRRDAEHTYHPSCTARIGSESSGVVGPDLRVHGVAGLRVADASVFPRITHGNTHAPSVVVGEKAADLIKAG
ncbi:MAG: GMC family oxidoreductase N-terminal domain-containing protein [Nocardioides sp.]|nr:GMC family oxidoreductase N-terminal domain-containing protein [Nocardioides sp.]